FHATVTTAIHTLSLHDALPIYSVQQRTQEIGIRIALGASAHDVRKMIVRQGMALALAGVFIGVAAALGLTRLMASLLYGVTARDPIAMTSVALLLKRVSPRDRKSTRLNSSHVSISYAVFCLKKKKSHIMRLLLLA